MSADYDNRYARDILGRQEAIRLDWLTDWHALAVTCTSCRHEGYIEAVRLRRYYPRHMKILSMEHRFKCMTCGARGLVMWTIVKQKR